MQMPGKFSVQFNSLNNLVIYDSNTSFAKTVFSEMYRLIGSFLSRLIALARQLKNDSLKFRPSRHQLRDTTQVLHRLLEVATKAIESVAKVE